jgi:hypothetical protein
MPTEVYVSPHPRQLFRSGEAAHSWRAVTPAQRYVAPERPASGAEPSIWAAVLDGQCGRGSDVLADERTGQLELIDFRVRGFRSRARMARVVSSMLDGSALAFSCIAASTVRAGAVRRAALTAAWAMVTVGRAASRSGDPSTAFRQSITTGPVEPSKTLPGCRSRCSTRASAAGDRRAGRRCSLLCVPRKYNAAERATHAATFAALQGRRFARVENGQAGAGTPSRTMTGNTRSVFCS